MAVCEYCGQEMLKYTSCVPKIIIDGVTYERIKYGHEDGGKGTFGSICPDCSCILGDYHHFNCDIEISPVDGRQLLMQILEDREGTRIIPTR